MATSAEDELRKEILARRVLVIAGTGVSLSTTDSSGRGIASWQGLLHNGVERCLSVLQPSPAKTWGKRIRACIGSADIDDLLAAAQQIQRKLSRPPEGNFGKWLRETVGSLSVADDSLIRAIADLGVPIATTNYDGLIAKVAGKRTITWRDHGLLERWSRGDEDAVFHIHGHWEKPESVILGVSSYEDIIRDPTAQHILRNCFSRGRILFLGFGAGLEDPNFAALLAWHRQVFPVSEYPHFRLAIQKDLRRLKKIHGLAGDNISVLCCGENHSDLVPFVRGLCPPRSDSPSPPAVSSVSFNPSGNIIEVFDMIESQRLTLSPSDYLGQVSRAASLCWVASRNSLALAKLTEAFEFAYPHISKHQRVEVGLSLIGMLDSGNMAEEAAELLQRIWTEAQELDTVDPRRISAEDLVRKRHDRSRTDTLLGSDNP